MPFIQSRIVRWGDCDPAGIIYTPRILDYAIETVETCLREVMGASWNVMREQHNIGKPLAPDMAVDLVLTLEKLGRSSMTSRIVCVDAEGVEYFRVLLVNCFVTGDSPTDIRALPISETWRERLKTLITENATEDG